MPRLGRGITEGARRQILSPLGTTGVDMAHGLLCVEQSPPVSREAGHSPSPGGGEALHLCVLGLASQMGLLSQKAGKQAREPSRNE